VPSLLAAVERGGDNFDDFEDFRLENGSSQGRSTDLTGLLARIRSAAGGTIGVYRSTSLIRKRRPLGPYSRPMPRALWWS